MMEPPPPETFWSGLSIQDRFAIGFGFAGMLMGAVGLILNWRSHVYTKSKDKVRLHSVIGFDELASNSNMEIFLGAVMRVDLGNAGVDIMPKAVALAHASSFLAPRYKYHEIPRLHLQGGWLKAGDDCYLSFVLPSSSTLGRHAKLVVWTRSGQKVFVCLRNWKRAKADFEKWKAEQPPRVIGSDENDGSSVA